MLTITGDDLRRLCPAGKPAIVAGILDNQEMIARGGIDTPIRLGHFMAQISFESAWFRTTTEYASGSAYEGRKDLGNIHYGDGKRYRGRGLIQTTGRSNYCSARDDIRRIVPGAPDFEAEPEKLAEFPWALLSAISYWRLRDINRFADRDNLKRVTKLINGGLNGLEWRSNSLAMAKRIWMS